MRITARHGSRLRCAYCHDDALEPLVTCSGCGAIVHLDCADGPLCPTLGCRASLRAKALAASDRWVDEELARADRERERRERRALWSTVLIAALLVVSGVGMPVGVLAWYRHHDLPTGWWDD